MTASRPRAGRPLISSLLFAAALFVVGPAEASRTTTDARSSTAAIAATPLAPSASLELPSLELSLLKPIDPVESSPRVGFGEDLGLLDPERGPGGFVVFAAEAAQYELTYARNNPLKYVDPDGREVALASGLSGGSRRFITNALTEMVRRPLGRAVFQQLVGARELLTIGTGTLNEASVISTARRTRGDVKLTFGLTTAVHPLTNEIKMTLDQGAIQEFSRKTQGHVSADGVITTGHEFDHARTALERDDVKLRAGDETGSSQRFGEGVAAQKPDLSRDEAAAMVDAALNRKAPCDRSDGPCR